MITTILIIALVALIAFAPSYIVCNVRNCYGDNEVDADEVDFLRLPLLFSVLFIRKHGTANAKFISMNTYYGMMDEIDKFLKEFEEKFKNPIDR